MENSKSNVAKSLAEYWDINPETATYDEVSSACARYKIYHAEPPGYWAFMVDSESNKKMVALRRAKLAEPRGLPY
jgi:hypothetical protein